MTAPIPPQQLDPYEEWGGCYTTVFCDQQDCFWEVPITVGKTGRVYRREARRLFMQHWESVHAKEEKS